MKTATRQRAGTGSIRKNSPRSQNPDPQETLFQLLSNVKIPSSQQKKGFLSKTQKVLTKVFLAQNHLEVQVITVSAQSPPPENHVPLTGLSTKGRQQGKSEKAASAGVIVTPSPEISIPSLALHIDPSQGTAHFVAVNSKSRLEVYDKPASALLQWYTAKN